MNQEHIFADWISNRFGRDRGLYQLVRHDGTIARSFPVTVFQQKLPVVCEPCNTGWMSVIESRVSKILGPMMVDAITTVLSPKTQRQIAAWAVKTALVLDLIEPTARVVADSEYSAFYAAKQPCACHIVWLAHRAVFDKSPQGDELVSEVFKTPVPIDAGRAVAQRWDSWVAEGRRVYAITFTVGHVVFQVFGHNLPNPVVLDTETRARAATSVVQRIWPVQGRITWPPSSPIESIGGTVGLHRAFQRQGAPPEPK
jgi:hypothetical protein